MLSKICCLLCLACLLQPNIVSSAKTAQTSNNKIKEKGLRLVTDIYDEEGISIRHMGKLFNIPTISMEAVETILQTPARGLMNFSTVSEPENLEDDAYTMTVYGGFIGYEGLIFDHERAFNPDSTLTDAIYRPEMVTFQLSAEKPRPDPASNGTRILIDWDTRWPKRSNKNSHITSNSEGPTWVHRKRIISLLQRSSHAYYHFLCEALPRIYLLSFELAEYPDAEVIPPSRPHA
jgi:hypothetical protein